MEKYCIGWGGCFVFEWLFGYIYYDFIFWCGSDFVIDWLRWDCCDMLILFFV